MKGKKVTGSGVTGVTVEFNMNELVVINDLCENIMRDINYEHGDDETAITTLVKIISRIPQSVFDLSNTYKSLLESESIFDEDKRPGKIDLD